MSQQQQNRPTKRKRDQNQGVAVALVNAASTSAPVTAPTIAPPISSSVAISDIKKRKVVAATAVQANKAKPTAASAPLAAGPSMATVREAKGDRSFDEDTTNMVKGKWSRTEGEKVREAVERLIRDKNITDVDELFTQKRNKNVRGAWHEIAKAVPQRGVRAVYDYCFRNMAKKKEGAWSAEEEAILKRLFQEQGPKWASIGRTLGRHRHSVRDKMREMGCKKGTWTEEEDKLLLKLVQEVCPGDEPPKNNINWTIIAQRMENRSHAQCRNRWLETLYPVLTNAPAKWSAEHYLQLVEGVLATGAIDETEVDWSNLMPHWSAVHCKYRWKSVVKRLPHSDTLSFQEKAKKARDLLKEETRSN